MPAYGYSAARSPVCAVVCQVPTCGGGDDPCGSCCRCMGPCLLDEQPQSAPDLSPEERAVVERFDGAGDPYSLDHEPFVAQRGAYGWHYAGDAVEHVERHNCSKGCAVPNPNDVAEHGPGGCCDLLASLFTGDPISEFEGTPTHVVCHVRQPIGGA